MKRKSFIKRRDTVYSELYLARIGRRLLLEKEKRKLNQSQFIRMIGISPPAYKDLVNGTANPTLTLLADISNGLEITLEELMFGRPLDGEVYVDEDADDDDFEAPHTELLDDASKN